MEFSTAFDSGGAVIADIDDSERHVELTRDEQYGYESPFFQFRVDGVAAQTISFELTGVEEASRMPLDYHLVYSETPGPEGWARFEESVGGGWFHTCASDTLYVASWQPYPYWAIVDRVEKLARHEYVETEVIGRSQQGRAMYAYRITDPAVPDAEKRDVVMLTRQHPGETQGSFFLDGVTDLILERFRSGDGFSEEYVFHAIPVGNPDGIHHAFQRRDTLGNDPQREWDTETPVEVATMAAYMRENLSDIYWGFDWHATTNPPGDSYPVVWYNEAVGSETVTRVTETIHERSRSDLGCPEQSGDSSWSLGFFAEEFDRVLLGTEASTYFEYSRTELYQEAREFLSTIIQ